MVAGGKKGYRQNCHLICWLSVCHSSIHVFRDWENNLNWNTYSYNRNIDCDSPASYWVKWAWGNSWSNMKMKWLGHAYYIMSFDVYSSICSKISFDCWTCYMSVTVIHLICGVISCKLLLSLQKENVLKKKQYFYFPKWLSSPKVVIFH